MNFIACDNNVTENKYIENQINYVSKRSEQYKLLIQDIIGDKEMGGNIKLSIGIPIHTYHSIDKTLESLTAMQKKIDISSYEIILLINKPNNNYDYDHDTISKIKLFINNNINYNINEFYHCFDFKDQKIMMGEIYKVLGDIIIKRNIDRMNTKTEIDNISHLLMRLSGSDSTKKNPNFLYNTIEAFQLDKKLVRLTSESRIDYLVSEKYPLIHIMHTLENSINRLWTKGKKNSNIGNGTFKAHIYSEIGGHNQNIHIMEDVELINRMKEYIKNNDIYKEKHHSTINAIDNSCDRAIKSIINNNTFVNRYDNNAFMIGDDSTKNIDRENDQYSNHENIICSNKNIERELNSMLQLLIKRVENNSQTYKNIITLIDEPKTRIEERNKIVKKIYQKAMQYSLGLINNNDYYLIEDEKYNIECKLNDDIGIYLSTKLKDKITKLKNQNGEGWFHRQKHNNEMKELSV